jgi:hypothetical protein
MLRIHFLDNRLRLILVGCFTLAVLMTAVGCAFDDSVITTGTALDFEAPGEYITMSERNVSAGQTFTQEDKIVASYYFYWYNVDTGEHIYSQSGSDILQDYPITLTGFSYNNVEWHKQEMLDMLDAGINVVLPVYWGDSNSIRWSIPGLKKLVEACESLEREGIEAPKIGMFYDTSSLMVEGKLPKGEKYPDLTDILGKTYFYKLIRDFYSLVPPKFRARIDGKPIVWLYGSNFCSNHDQETFDFADQMFQQDFGGKDLYIVRERSWNKASSENVYDWGVALGGPSFLGVIAVGPGFNNTAVATNSTPSIRERENGLFYKNSWSQALVNSVAYGMNIVVIETWNEFHEGTDIAHSWDYKRQYIDMTREYSAMFKAGSFPKDLPGNEYLNASNVWVKYDETSGDHGVINVQVSDGMTTMVKQGGVNALKSVRGEYSVEYLYFKINDYFKIGKQDSYYKVKIRYYDAPQLNFLLQYDSKDPRATLDGTYKNHATNVQSAGSNTWKTVEFLIKDAWFAGRQNGGTDFRIALPRGTGLLIRSIEIEAVEK